MAECIVLEKARFEELFKVTEDRLKLEWLQNEEFSRRDPQLVRDLHRKFHYHLHDLKQNLIKG